MTGLHFFPTTEINELVWPNVPENLSLQTPALEFFTDFEHTTPLVIEASASALDAKQMMIKSHVRLKIVVDATERFLGIISADDLLDRKIVQKVAMGQRREEVLVSDLMTSKKDLVALDYKEIAKASIGDVIDTLQHLGQQHCLVIDYNSGKIRGVFSATEISKKLKLPIDIQGPQSFYRVFLAVTHQLDPAMAG